jgi:hypothetical protein
MSRHHRPHRWFTYRTPIILVIGLFFVGLIGYDYIRTEYLANKGPDDFWTQSNVAAYLRYKFGEMSKGDAMRSRIADFKPDALDAKSGTYTFECWYKGQHLTVQTYYNKGNYSNWTNFPTHR